jgi:hypothetical protein
MWEGNNEMKLKETVCVAVDTVHLIQKRML